MFKSEALLSLTLFPFWSHYFFVIIGWPCTYFVHVRSLSLSLCVLVLSLYGAFSRSTWVVLYAGKRNMHQYDEDSRSKHYKYS
jgi:hypothetical protein